jgi:hypothetical protein
MGYGWNTRSAEDVQRHNGKDYDFAKIKEAYESIKPLRGKRSHLNIRPHGERNRAWERVVKVSDNEYYITNQAYAYWERKNDPDRNMEHNRAITFVMAGNIEYLTIHTPRRYWGDNTKLPFAERKEFDSYGFVAPSNYYFYYYNLPRGLNMCKYGSKAYIEVRSEEGKAGKCYTLKQGDVVLTRKQGEDFFRPLVVHREIKRILDRQQTKTIRQELEPFVNYVSVMSPLMEKKHVDHRYRNPFSLKEYTNTYGAYGVQPEEGYKDVVNKSWSELVSMKGDELPEYWFNMAQSYRSRMETSRYDWETKQYEEVPITPQRIKDAIYKDVYREAMPFKTEEVELGIAFKNNKYYSW